MMSCKIVNLESGMPTVSEAEARLDAEIIRAKAARVAVLKIIHGYGSTGVGGKIKVAVGRKLSQKAARREIKAYVPGDNWTIFDSRAREIIEMYPEMRKDSDLERHNPGISIVVLR